MAATKAPANPLKTTDYKATHTARGEGLGHATVPGRGKPNPEGHHGNVVASEDHRYVDHSAHEDTGTPPHVVDTAQDYARIMGRR